MLILTRRIGQAFVVDRDITVSVIAVHGNNVRLGIDAPDHIAVFREEISERLRREKDLLDAAEKDASSA